jgi:hypothetical protein
MAQAKPILRTRDLSDQELHSFGFAHLDAETIQRLRSKEKNQKPFIFGETSKNYDVAATNALRRKENHLNEAFQFHSSSFGSFFHATTQTLEDQTNIDLAVQRQRGLVSFFTLEETSEKDNKALSDILLRKENQLNQNFQFHSATHKNEEEQPDIDLAIKRKRGLISFHNFNKLIDRASSNDSETKQEQQHELSSQQLNEAAISSNRFFPSTETPPTDPSISEAPSAATPPRNFPDFSSNKHPTSHPTVEESFAPSEEGKIFSQLMLQQEQTDDKAFYETNTDASRSTRMLVSWWALAVLSFVIIMVAGGCL